MSKRDLTSTEPKFEHAIRGFVPLVSPISAGALLKTKWIAPPDWVFEILKPQVPALASQIEGITNCGLYVLQAGCAAIFAQRTEGVFDQRLNRSMVDAFFAYQFDWRYYKNYDFSDEGLKKLEPARRWRASISHCFNAPLHPGARGFLYTPMAAAADYVVRVTRQVLDASDHASFDAWLVGVLERLHRHAERWDRTHPRINDCKSPEAFDAEARKNHGAPLPLELLDLSFDLDGANLDALAAARLKTIDPTNNARLRVESELRELRFQGTPYRPDTKAVGQLIADRKARKPVEGKWPRLSVETLFPRAKKSAAKGSALAKKRSFEDDVRCGLEVLLGAELTSFPKATYLAALAIPEASSWTGTLDYASFDEEEDADEATVFPMLGAACWAPVAIGAPSGKAKLVVDVLTTLFATKVPRPLPTTTKRPGGKVWVEGWVTPSELRRLKKHELFEHDDVALEFDDETCALFALGATDGSLVSALKWATCLHDDGLTTKLRESQASEVEVREALEAVEDVRLRNHLTHFADQDGSTGLARRKGGEVNDVFKSIVARLKAKPVVSFELSTEPSLAIHVLRTTSVPAAALRGPSFNRPIALPLGDS